MIDATLSGDAAAAHSWDAVVVGAGPAGAAAALRLTRLGRRVLLLERRRFPRPKVCGCCLSPAALRELEYLGLPTDCLPTPVPLQAVRLVVGGRTARIAMPGGGTLSREALDTALVQAALDAGAAWISGLNVVAIEEQPTVTVVTVRTTCGARLDLRANAVVIAAGLADAIRVGPADGGSLSPSVPGPRPLPRRGRRIAPTSWIGLGATLDGKALDLPSGELVMAVGPSGYTGIVRLDDGRLDVAAAVAPAAVTSAGGPAAAIEAIVVDSGFLPGQSATVAALRRTSIRATPSLTHTSPLVAGPRGTILRIGDAAAYVEPFTGEGIGWGLASARILGEAASAATRGMDLAVRYRADHARLFALHHARCRSVACLVRHPRVLAGAVRLATVAPRIAARTVPWLVGGGRLA